MFRRLFIIATLAVAAPAWADLPVAITYLRLEVDRPPVLSNLDPVPEDLGLAGAEIAVKDTQTTGSFLGHGYSLTVVSVPPEGDFPAAAREVLKTSRLILIDADPAAILSVADLPQAQDALLFNVSSGAESLRSADCRANLLHTIPEDAARTDALMQVLQRKQWQTTVLITGPKPADLAFAEALRRSATKFGITIAAEKEWTFDTDLRDSTMDEVPRFTQDFPDHDVILVADETDDFGRYVEHNSWLPRPVAGSDGMVPTAWSPVIESWGAVQLQNRFEAHAHRPMRGQDYAAWAAVRAIGEAVTRTNANDPATLRAFLLDPGFQMDGFKGRGLSFRAWNGQLRQPIAVVNARALVTLAPVEGFLHQRNEMDTLGLDAPEFRLHRLQGPRMIRALTLCLLAAPAMADEIWVTNEKDDTISVIDTETLEVIRTIPTGERPRGITFSHDFSRVYICASDSDTVQVMDPATGEILHDLPSGEDPEQFVLHPDDRHLWIANEDDAVTTVVDVDTRKVVAQINVGIEPEGMGVSRDGSIVVTTSETTNMAHWIDTATHQIIANTLVDSRPRHAEFTDTELWVSSEVGGTVTVFDIATKAEKAKIRFEIPGVNKDLIQPVGFEFTPDHSTAFVALGPSNHVAVVNMQTYQVETYILVGRRVWHLAFNRDHSQLFTTNGVSGDVTVIDVASRTALKSIKVGRFPWGRRLPPHGMTDARSRPTPAPRASPPPCGEGMGGGPILALLALPAQAQDAPAGLFAATNKQDLPEIILSAGEPLGPPWVLKSGTYYEVEITSDGSQELALSGPDFFRAIWIDEIVIEGLEIRPLGLDSVEFDQAGTMEIGFIAIKPGTYTLRTPQGGETQTLRITIE